MINKIKEKVNNFIESVEKQAAPNKVVLVDTGAAHMLDSEPDMRVIGLFTDVGEEKLAELVQAILYMDELNKMQSQVAAGL